LPPLMYYVVAGLLAPWAYIGLSMLVSLQVKDLLYLMLRHILKDGKP
jgi:hypothetical protein